MKKKKKQKTKNILLLVFLPFKVLQTFFFFLSTLHIKVKGLRTIHQSFKPDQPNRFGPTQRVTNNFKRSSTYYLLLNVSMSM